MMLIEFWALRSRRYRSGATRHILVRGEGKDYRCPLAEARDASMASVPSHLRIEASGTELEAISELRHLVEDFLGGLIGNSPVADVAQDEGGLALHRELSFPGRR
jgi:hypothetical protein